MKRALAIGLLSFFSSSIHGQIIARFYYNKNWQLTTKDSVEYFRACVFDTTLRTFAGEIRDFTKDGKLVMKGGYSFGKKDGVFTFYFASGNVESTGRYQSHYRTGIWKYFYPGGAVRAEIDFGIPSGFMNISVPRILSFTDSTGNQLLKDGTGDWIEVYEDIAITQRIVIRGKYKNFQKVGEWTCKLADGTLIYTEVYEKGRFIRGRTTKIAGEEGPSFMPMQNHLLEPFKLGVTEKLILAKGVGFETYPFLRPKPGMQNQQFYFSVIETSALPEGGMENFNRVVEELLEYPVQARRMGIEGRVLVEFVIRADGTLGDAKVAKGIGAGCDEEALRVVIESQTKCKWKPGTQKGHPVPQRVTLPITFNLDAIGRKKKK